MSYTVILSIFNAHCAAGRPSCGPHRPRCLIIYNSWALCRPIVQTLDLHKHHHYFIGRPSGESGSTGLTKPNFTCNLSGNFPSVFSLMHLFWQTLFRAEWPCMPPNKQCQNTERNSNSDAYLHRFFLHHPTATGRLRNDFVVGGGRQGPITKHKYTKYTLHRESKKGDAVLLSIFLLNIDRFS